MLWITNSGRTAFAQFPQELVRRLSEVHVNSEDFRTGKTGLRYFFLRFCSRHGWLAIDLLRVLSHGPGTMITQLDLLSCVLRPVSKAGRLSVTAAQHSRDLEPKLRESRTTQLDVTVESLISQYLCVETIILITHPIWLRGGLKRWPHSSPNCRLSGETLSRSGVVTAGN